MLNLNINVNRAHTFLLAVGDYKSYWKEKPILFEVCVTEMAPNNQILASGCRASPYIGMEGRQQRFQLTDNGCT